jgi:prephenate dehydrogenase
LVAGYVRRAATAKDCERVRALDLATRDLREAITGAELVVLCTPIAQMAPLVERMAPFLSPGAVVTDVGSVKQSLVGSLSPAINRVGAHFIGSHPMAGSEKTGVCAARADLFVDAICVVTPTAAASRNAVKTVTDLWTAVGARVLRLAPAVHDELVSRSSHLPHVVAAQLANLVLHPGSPKHQAALCANGFRDTTRIAAGSPEMWRDIALTNRKNLMAAIDAFVGGLADFKRALKTGDSAAVTRFFEQAKTQRDKWSRQAPAHSPE